MTSWGWCIDIVDVDVDVPDGMEVALVGLAGLSSIRIKNQVLLIYMFCSKQW